MDIKLTSSVVTPRSERGGVAGGAGWSGTCSRGRTQIREWRVSDKAIHLALALSHPPALSLHLLTPL
eukprot:scaffold6852_cov134-Isochrysis_galbana.AAC.2